MRTCGAIWVISGMATMGMAQERQVTTDVEFNHALDNNDNFSPDDRFLCFDTRPDGAGIGRSRVIGKVEIATGRITRLYEARDANAFGPGVGAVSYCPVRNEVIFIHGPQGASSEETGYQKHRRVGAIVSGNGSGAVRFADARDVSPPFTPGALRGGTHRHEYSGDGQWVGYTYNDAVVRAHGLSIGKDLDLRTIGVTRLGRVVTVEPEDGFASRGEGFSVIVVHVLSDPKPGSDEISHAAGDSWVGSRGYLRPDGKRQLARAFIGTVVDKQGRKVDELFIVDIPDDITRPGPLGPLEGTATAMPAPPAGTVQRRLIHTAESRHPGCKGTVRSSPDGEHIAHLARDAKDKWQVFLISPRGGSPVQCTFLDDGVTEGIRWHPAGKTIVGVSGTRIFAVNIERARPIFGQAVTIIDRAPAPTALVVSNRGHLIAYNRPQRVGGRVIDQIFVCPFPDEDGDGVADAAASLRD